jgi:hypothetical protein
MKRCLPFCVAILIAEPSGGIVEIWVAYQQALTEATYRLKSLFIVRVLI